MESKDEEGRKKKGSFARGLCKQVVKNGKAPPDGRRNSGGGAKQMKGTGTKGRRRAQKCVLITAKGKKSTENGDKVSGGGKAAWAKTGKERGKEVGGGEIVNRIN